MKSDRRYDVNCSPSHLLCGLSSHRLSLDLIQKLIPKGATLWWIINPGKTELRDRPELCLCFVLGLTLATCRAALAAAEIFGVVKGGTTKRDSRSSELLSSLLGWWQGMQQGQGKTQVTVGCVDRPTQAIWCGI